jgi:hypothetical protein
MNFRRSFLALSVAFLVAAPVAPAMASAATSSPANPPVVAAATDPAPAAAAMLDEVDYAAREAAARELEDFRGGDAVNVLLIILIVVAIVALIAIAS